MIVINNGVMPDACVLAIGKFESIHLGHRALLAEVVRQADLLNLASAVMVFDPHPYIFLSDPGYKPLFTNDERNHLLDDKRLFCDVQKQIMLRGLDYLYYCPFDENFASLSPDNFCKFIFVDCKAKLVIIGENYRFGKDRTGDTAFLQSAARQYDAKIQTLPIKNTNDSIICTSNIRTLIAEGKLKEARQLLGFPFFSMGIIENENDDLNIHVSEKKFLPLDGIYCSNTIIAGAIYRSTTTVEPRVKTRIHDYKLKGLVGAPVKIEFIDTIPSGE